MVSQQDIEGWEWSVLPLIYKMKPEDAPIQFSLEVHMHTAPNRVADLLTHIIKMHELGYLLLMREVNLRCAHCCELTWIKQNTKKLFG